MATFPSATQVAGANIAGYESLFRQVDKLGTGRIGAVDAAAFLKKSGLRETILHKIWELSDPHGKGFLDKQGFTVALKLIALAQSGKDVSLSGITFPAPMPKLDGTPVHGRSGSPAMGDISWVVQTEDKIKYDGIFDGLSPVDSKLSGDKVKGVFMNSKLPVDILSRIWDLSDIDKDGLLDRDEFAVAMHLVYRALEKDPIPPVLPLKLIPPSKRKKSGLPGAIPVLPSAPSAGGLRRVTPPPTSQALRSVSPSLAAFPQLPVAGAASGAVAGASSWVVTAEDKSNCDILFKQLDAETKGYLTGDQVKPSLMETGLPHQTLAHIWNLCDIKLTGKLNSDQFALAMYLVKQAKSGVMPPVQLTPEMVPPTFRPKPGGADSALADLTATLLPGSSAGPGDFSAIKELDSISKEIDTLTKEKATLQSDIRDKEEVIKMKNMEVLGLQTELDKSSAQVRQLEGQKAEAQKRLDELDQQKTKLEGLLAEVQVQCQEVQKSVDSLRGQISTQQTTVKKKKLKGEEAKKVIKKAQEEELKKAQTELITLRKEEQQLEQQMETGKSQLGTVEESLNQTNEQITQLSAKLASIRETKTKLNGTMSQISSAMDTAHSTGTMPSIEELGSFSDSKFGMSHDDIFSSRATCGSSSPVSSLSGFSVGSEVNSKTGDGDDKDDPFKGKDPFANIGETQSGDPFSSEDPFKDNDPFKNDAFAANPFGGDPFKSDPFASQTKSNTEDPFAGSANSSKDPFASSSPGTNDPFGGSGTSAASKDPFGGSGTSAASKDPFGGSGTTAASKDPFGGSGTTAASKDPFGGSGTSAASKDPFGGSGTTAASKDPFGGSGTTAASKDPFGGSETTAASKDPFGGSGTSAASKDPFGGSGTSAASKDPFGGSGTTAASKDPFSGSGTTASSTDPFADSDPFGSKSDPFATNSSSNSKDDPFATQGSKVNEDPFASQSASSNDPFASKSSTTSTDPFASSNTSKSSDPFASVQGSKDSSDPFAGSGNADDPFKGKDPFASDSIGGLTNGNTESKSTSDPFGSIDPFGGSAFKADSFSKSSSTDTFSSDPFSGKPEDTPALPPKKSRGVTGVTGIKPLSNSPSATSSASDPFQAFSADSSTLSDPFGKPDSSGSNDPFASTGSSIKVSTSSSNDAFATNLSGKDPFSAGSAGGGADPFSGGGDPFSSTAGGKDSGNADPFANFADFGSAKFESNLTEEDQLVWAVTEGQKEEERQKKLAMQEENDLKRALQLSQEEVGSSEA